MNPEALERLIELARKGKWNAILCEISPCVELEAMIGWYNEAGY